MSSTAASALSSQSLLPSRQGADNHSFPSPRWVPADGPDDCYYCYCCYLHQKGRAADLCLPGEGRNRKSSWWQAAKALKVLAEEKAAIHAGAVG